MWNANEHVWREPAITKRSEGFQNLGIVAQDHLFRRRAEVVDLLGECAKVCARFPE
jgi:hypothetical protein